MTDLDLSPSCPSAFSPLLAAEDEAAFCDGLGSRWVATCGFGCLRPARHPEHARWIAQEAHLHRPPVREVLTLLSGELIFSVAGKPYRLTPGAVVFFDRHEARDWVSPPRRPPYHALWLHFYGPQTITFSTAERLADGRLSRLLTARMRAGVPQLLESWDHCRDHAPGAALHWKRLCSLTVATVLDILATARPIAPRQQARKAVQAVQERVRHQLNGDLRLGPLAAFAGYNPHFFHRIFRQETGETLKGYVNRLRLERVQRGLRAGLTLEAVAESVGMESASSLSRFFRGQTGITPGQWRAQAGPLPAHSTPGGSAPSPSGKTG